ncbi:MAG: hypothetical protein JNJ56_09630 [Ignavibacteria bacterium]|nr:hypothetical protein [Ignavibacteria bacterium]
MICAESEPEPTVSKIEPAISIFISVLRESLQILNSSFASNPQMMAALRKIESTSSALRQFIRSLTFSLSSFCVISIFSSFAVL